MKNAVEYAVNKNRVMRDSVNWFYYIVLFIQADMVLKRHSSASDLEDYFTNKLKIYPSKYDISKEKDHDNGSVILDLNTKICWTF